MLSKATPLQSIHEHVISIITHRFAIFAQPLLWDMILPSIPYSCQSRVFFPAWGHSSSHGGMAQRQRVCLQIRRLGVRISLPSFASLCMSHIRIPCPKQFNFPQPRVVSTVHAKSMRSIWSPHFQAALAAASVDGAASNSPELAALGAVLLLQN